MWTLLDPILSVLVAGRVAKSVWSLVSDSIRVLLQAVPRGMDAFETQRDLASIPGVAETGHFHAWPLTDQTIIATVHVTLPQIVAAWLQQHYAIDHVTVQVDRVGELKAINH